MGRGNRRMTHPVASAVMVVTPLEKAMPIPCHGPVAHLHAAAGPQCGQTCARHSSNTSLAGRCAEGWLLLLTAVGLQMAGLCRQ